ncbi:glycosyltransferase family 2 protein [Streptomyces sp. GD-15H]|uniref:glycosyltransferase family 2 protein n=1 Tax=Streptomyces sp. GD-15H TaxID=3129112 RepID=UPI00324F7EBB
MSRAKSVLPRPESKGPDDPALVIADVRALSRGKVARVTNDGPEFALPPESRRVRPDTFRHALSPGTRLLAALLAAGWVGCAGLFWFWWLQPEHRAGTAALIVNSSLLLYLAMLPLPLVVAIFRLRRVNPALEVPRLAVAFVVTKAPSEPWRLARTNLEAMLAQEFPYPYDVWLCDEDPTPETEEWCEAHGVRISSRRGVDGYHRPAWPRRTRCKEGNLAWFYDCHGYTEYDVVAQLDCDHVPHPTYLREMVRPFADPAIGYVAAPSQCDSNAELSWSARGRLHREATFHGVVQLGHSDGLAPICIGSHYAVRTQALRDIGGIGPELAEDFTTSFLLNSAGWNGAFAIDAEAHGEGPLTFGAMVTQEFQWSRSLVTALIGMFPKHLRRLPMALRLRFGYALFFYPLMAGTTAAALMLPPLAAVTGEPWMNVNYFEFLGHFWSMSVWLIALAWLMRRRGLLRPRQSPLLSWESALFALARWPFVAWGVLAAVMDRLRPRSLTFKVTPKSRDSLAPLPLRLVMPYQVITVVLASAAVVGELTGPAYGYVFLCILGAGAYTVVTVAVCCLHAFEAAKAVGVDRVSALVTVRVPLAITMVTTTPLAFAMGLYPRYLLGFLQL